MRRFEPIPGVDNRTAGCHPGALLLSIGKVPVDPALIAAHAAAKAERARGDGAFSADSVSAAAAAAAAKCAASAYAEPLGVEACAACLRDAPFPKTSVLLRDMDAYLALKNYK